LQAVESKNVIASDDFLASLLETVKEGVLNCKIVAKDGKRHTDRSWRPAWAVLKKSGALFLCKEKKDNIMIPSVDAYPINLKNAIIDIAYDYTKRKNVFKINTFSNSEYLFQTIDHESMIEWIRIMQENTTPPDLEKLLLQKQQQQQQLQQQLSSSNSPDTNNKLAANMTLLNINKPPKNDWLSNTSSSSLNNENVYTNSSNNASVSLYNNEKLAMKQRHEQHHLSGSHFNYISNEVSSPDDLYANQALSPNAGNNFGRNKSDDTSPRRETSSTTTSSAAATTPTNRKWVRQMTRRIRDFMTSSTTGDADSSQNQGNSDAADYSSNRNFSIHLDKCEPSTVSPVRFHYFLNLAL
jgi:hypothetical protein